MVKFKPEYIPLAVNVSTMLWYAWQYKEPGKIIYWLGATLITVGLTMMKG